MARSTDDPAAPAAFTLRRRQPESTAVQLDVLFCGVCPSDLHQVRDEWHGSMPTIYRCAPGHEIVGRVVAVGRDVRGFKEGDLAAVDFRVDSCHIDLCFAWVVGIARSGTGDRVQPRRLELRGPRIAGSRW